MPNALEMDSSVSPMDLIFDAAVSSTSSKPFDSAGKAVALPDMRYQAGEIIGKKGGRR